MNYKNLVIATGLLLSPLSANALDVGVGFKGGTTGVGVDLSFVLTDTLNLRFSSTSYDFGDTDSEIDFDLDDNGNRVSIIAETKVDFDASGLLLDWYVFDGTFHVTAGMIKNNSKIAINGRFIDDGSGSISFNGNNYNISDFVANEIGGEFDFGDSYEPYIGVGWGRKASAETGFSLSVEIGVMILDPSIKLTAPTLNQSAGFTQSDQDILDADVKQAETEASEELSDFELYPVLSVGINYAF